MNNRMIIRLAAHREQGLDQPDLADHPAAWAWEAWTALQGLLELPADVEELINLAGAELEHLDLDARRRVWECAHAAAWGHARPVPQPLLPAGVRHRQPPRARRPLAPTVAPPPTATTPRNTNIPHSKAAAAKINPAGHPNLTPTPEDPWR